MNCDKNEVRRNYFFCKKNAKLKLALENIDASPMRPSKTFTSGQILFDLDKRIAKF